MTKKFYQAVGLTFALSWSLALIAKYILNITYLGTQEGILLGVLYMFTPATAVIILSKLVWKIPLKTYNLKKPSNKLFLLAIFLPIIYSILTALVSLLIPGVSFSIGMEGLISKYQNTLTPEQLVAAKQQLQNIGLWMIPLILGQVITAGVTVNAVAALGEELLWRGFLLKELKNLNWLKTSLIIGSIWGLWHAPLILQGHNYPSNPILGVFLMIIWCTLLTPTMVYITAKTKSVLSAAVYHGTLNASYAISILWIVGGNDLTIGITGLAGFIALLIINTVLYALDKKGKIDIQKAVAEY